MGADVFNLRNEYVRLAKYTETTYRIMALDSRTVYRIAKLARIQIDDSEVDRYASELSSILEFVEQMNRVDTDDVAPLSHPQDRVLRLREDKVTESNQREQLLASAPAAENGLYLVPKVIE